MLHIPILSNNTHIVATLSTILEQSLQSKTKVASYQFAQQYIEFLNLEMSELILVDFSDTQFDALALLSSIIKDPWLLHCGIIGICKTHKDTEKIENIRGTNIIVVLGYDELEQSLPHVLSIINRNRRIIFQREIGRDIVRNISGSFKLDNDLLEAKCYVNLICNFLFNSNKLDSNKKFNLQLALIELLVNAIEHGNCKIDYKEKSQWLEKHRTTIKLIAQRINNPEIAKKKVLFEYSITPTSAKFYIADEGEGFDWRKVKDATKTENILSLHGRGILMTKHAVDTLTYNEKGNEVQFEITYETGESDIAPGLFEKMDPKNVTKDMVIFQQGEPSNNLYYIVKGIYSVWVNNKNISTLTPDDIFMGEMSFLLNNERSATVKAESEGKLIAITKKEFVEAIKEKPHYALFLARILAQRIERINQHR